MTAIVPVDTEKLRRARLRKGWTLRGLAARCEELGTRVDFGNIGRYERGDVGPSPGTIAVIAQALEVDVDDLLLPAHGNGGPERAA